MSKKMMNPKGPHCDNSGPNNRIDKLGQIRNENTRFTLP